MSYGGVAPELAPNPLHGTSKYKAYVAAVDKALKAFESTNEWADLISALGKLSKVFNSNSKYGDIPKPMTVAKRLSQCLHPALPMGVHLKALETYKQVFDILGTEKLAQLLYLFAIGLFPLMDHCGIKVKSELFSIFELYLLPLGAHLRPSLPGFLAGVLLGLEEGTEFYDRSVIFLDRVCEAVGGDAFFACVWEAVLGSPAVRLPALIYVNAKFDKNKPMKEQMHFIGNTELMIAALCAAADDAGSPLVQRHLLDFIVTAFPLDSELLSREHFVKLLQHALFVVLRRDMSLNRRLYQWLLNPTGSTQAVSGVAVGDDRIDSQFFMHTVLPLIHKALANYLALDTIEIPAPPPSHIQWSMPPRENEQQVLCEVRVCRLLLYLQDRPEIGRPILNSALPLFLMEVVGRDPQNRELLSNIGLSKSESRFTNDKGKATIEEIFEKRMEETGKSFNLLLHSLDDGFLWDHLAFSFSRLLLPAEDSTDEEMASERRIQLRMFPAVVRLCVRITQLDTSGATRSLHLPTLLRSILGDLARVHIGDNDVSMDVLLDTVSVCSTLLMEMAIGAGPITVSDAEDPSSSNSSPTKKITGDPQSDKEQKLVESCVVEALALFTTVANNYVEGREERKLGLLQTVCKLVWQFSDFPLYCLDLRSPIDTQWLVALKKVLSVCDWSRVGCECDFSARASCLDLLAYVYVRSGQVLEQHQAVDTAKNGFSNQNGSTTTVLLKPLLLEDDLRRLEVEKIFELSSQALWRAVGSSQHPEFHKFASRLLAILHARRPNDASSDTEGILVAALTSNDQVACAESARTFDRIWVLTRGTDELHPGLPPKLFSRVVMLLLGVLSDESVANEKTELKSAAVSWFVNCAKHNDLPRIVQMLSTMLMNPVTARVSIQYVTLESKIGREQLLSLPEGTQAVSLVTADQRQKMHHIVVDSPESASPLDPSSSWMCELRSRLLACAQQLTQGGVEQPKTVAENSRRQTCDIPNFDDDTDSISIDTLSLSMEGIDQAIVETVQYLVDMVVDEEESEMYAEKRFREAREEGKMEGECETESEPVEEVVVFRTGSEGGSPPKVLPDGKPPNGKTGKDSVSRVKKGHRRQDSLQESIFSCGAELRLLDQCELTSKPLPKEGSIDEEETMESPLFHELHTHMLLYGESGRLVDLGRAESAFKIMTALLRPRGGPVLPPRMLLNCLVSSGTSSQDISGSCLSGSLIDLMSRHVKAILGQQFWGNQTEDEGKATTTTNRHLTLLELLLTITLHFLRSYFLNSPIAPVSDDDLVKAWRCKMAALDFLTCVLIELGDMLRAQQSQALVVFVQSILSRSKLQKCLLHLLLTAVHDPRGTEGGSVPISVTIAEFNEGKWAGDGKRQRLNGLLSAYHSALLSLTAATIRLEHDIKTGQRDFGDQNASGIHVGRLSITHQLHTTPQHRGTVRDQQVALVELRMFLVTVLNAVKKRPERHETWLQFIVHILPWLDRSLSTFCVHVVDQLCKNIDMAATAAFPLMGKHMADRSPTDDQRDDSNHYPANYLITCLETLTTVMHFCMVESGGGSASSTIQDESRGTPTSNRPSTASATPSSSGPGMMGQAIQAIPGTQLFTNLVKVFSFSDGGASSGVPLAKTDFRSSCWQQARKDMLSGLPHALSTICDVWGVVRREETANLPLGETTQLRRLLIDLLSPLAQHHQSQWMQALSLVWLTRSTPAAQKRNDPDVPSFLYSSSQMDVADLLLSIRLLPLESVIGNVAETLKESAGKAGKPQTQQIDKATFPTEAPLLELLHGCIRQMNGDTLRPCWPSLHSLFMESSLATLPPRAVFLQFIMLCDFVRIVGAMHIVEDKSLAKGVHDSCQRLTEAVNGIVGWQLEATTWLKRTLVVKQDPAGKSSSLALSSSVDASPSMETASSAIASVANSELNSMRGSTLSLLQPRPTSLDPTGSVGGATTVSAPPLSGSSLADSRKEKSSTSLRGQIKDPNNNKRDPTHSTQALFLLAENLPDLMDSICKSDDKERLLPTLHAVWANVIPYLKAKNARNARFFLASSQLLANMSSYNYMRPVWKKTTLELLLDNSFFRMDIHSVRQWLIVSDHLMTHDKTSFKELLKSISYSTNASFSIMTSKEQEYEARTQALKRLAFIVLGSELDQYQTQLPDIQERLAENLRVCQAPPIRAAVFLCYRVLLIRLRPHSLVSMWPTMVTELVHVLLQVEQQLADDPTAEGGKEEVAGAKDDQWMQLFLAAAKLLETLCTLPAGYLAQFQMCNWAFVTSVAAGRGGSFIPFADRINKRLKTKYGKLSDSALHSLPASLGGMKMLTSFDELRPFFYALTMHGQTIAGTQRDPDSVFWKDAEALSGKLSHSSAVSRLEHALYVDFAEHWQL